MKKLSFFSLTKRIKLSEGLVYYNFWKKIYDYFYCIRPWLLSCDRQRPLEKLGESLMLKHERSVTTQFEISGIYNWVIDFCFMEKKKLNGWLIVCFAAAVTFLYKKGTKRFLKLLFAFQSTPNNSILLYHGVCMAKCWITTER